MKKKAILYIRVSTDEQADKGYSLAYQQERLVKYCEINDLEIVKIFKEDYSAKTFDRPAFKELMAFSKKNKAFIDHLLFIKWDRFSRNTRDSYYMINEFQRLNIEVCAIEQSLDLNIPEAKLMLAFYLAAPEVENDRRSLNVQSGMRKAKKEGRWVATAPLGYKNVRDENNRPVIVPAKEAGYIREAFEDISKLNLTIEEARRRLNSKGVKCSRSNFNTMVHNPVYAGKILISAFKDEGEEIVNGHHEAIIPETLFWDVQEQLKKSKPKNTKKIKTKDGFPLRGFLQCPQCGGTLTASSSRGYTGKLYAYYHCRNGCSERLQANQVNRDFVKLFESISANERVIDLYASVIRDLFKDSDNERREKQIVIQAKIDKNIERINEARDMRADRQIDTTEFNAMRKRYEDLNESLMREKMKLEDVGSNGKYLKGCVEYLKTLDRNYAVVPTSLKRLMISSIFAEKLVYEKNGFRTPTFTPAVACMTLKNSELQGIKTGLHQKNLIQSCLVAPTGIEPASKV